MSMRSKWFNKRKLNNSGAALVTVIIIIAFLSVLVTTILYMAGVNYFMKGADRETKESFYEAEVAMEQIRAKLMIDARDAFQVAYKEMLGTYWNNTGTERQAVLNEAYVDEFESIFVTKMGSRTMEQYLETMIDSKFHSGFTVGSASLDLTEDDQGRIYIRDLKLVYTKDSYTTMIETDIMIKLPDMDLTTDTSNTNWVTGDDPSVVLAREVYNMADCVAYSNWKKE